ncbi:CZB domain-containing protein [Aliiroseovarius lamellibrachiae]|uniref:CZB domain-containing protein n=1 Tax=Aliiroseovarius lamellibrachiae TaxID=1924933 RepID=UPI001BDFFDA2|nr:CZB domain-containing protein [Aliiroseovarius lamellibrachiae]MBT2131450.1 CZB domain-containing protein [Aliiroseovarius lamellibrachiae]
MHNSSLRNSIRAAIITHQAWKDRLQMAIETGQMADTVSDMSSDNKCPFGNWLYSPKIPADIKAGKPYQVIRRLHAEFHTCVGDIAKLAMSGDQATAQQMMITDFANQSDKLQRALKKWDQELLSTPV